MMVNANIQYVNSIGIPSSFMNMSRIPDIPMYGYAAYSIGTVDYECFCGWDMDQGMCTVPAIVCQDIGLTPECKYTPGTEAGREVVALIVSMWDVKGPEGTWKCPDIDLSDSWGIISTTKSDDWITSPSTTTTIEVDVGDLINAGRAGMRIGNINNLTDTVRKEGVWPSARLHKLQSDDGSTSIALKRCESTIASTFNAASVVDEIVDDLFPVAQGVYESAPVSICLRFSIEFSKLRILTAISESIRDISNDVAKQSDVTVSPDP
jgi:hypothetical protein